MSFQEILERYSPFIKQYWLSVFLGCIGLIFFVYGLIAFLSGENSQEPIVFEKENPQKKELTIIIDVSGAVVKPGVYLLPEDSRVQQALIEAGGLSQEANREWVDKYINLAAKLVDGQKVYIPKEGEGISAGATSIKSITGITSTTGSTGVGSEININTASIEELDSLSGVGVVIAQKIIDNRPYNTPEDLVTKKVVSSNVFEKIKGRVRVY